MTSAQRPIAWADPSELPDVEVDLSALDADFAAADDAGEDQDTAEPRSVRPRCSANPGKMTASFRAAATVWRKLAGRWIQILADDGAPELATVVQRISGLPMAERMKHGKDLGEIGAAGVPLMLAGAIPARRWPGYG